MKTNIAVNLRGLKPAASGESRYCFRREPPEALGALLRDRVLRTRIRHVAKRHADPFKGAAPAHPRRFVEKECT